MIKYFKDLLFTDTGKDTSIVFVGTLINVIVGGLFFILAPRILGPSNYGLFATIFATSVIAVRLSSLGIDTGILRFTHKNSGLSDAFLSIALKTYLVLGFSIAIVGFFLAPALASFLKQPSIIQLLRLAFASTILFHLTNLFTAGLQARREFLKVSIMLIANNITRLLLILIGSYFFTINLHLLTVIFFSSVLVSTFLGKLFIPFKLVAIDRTLERDFFKFNIWVWLSLSLASIPFDNYFLLKIAGPIQVGLYAAPAGILNFAYQLGSNFTTVLASRFSTFDSNQKAKNFASKSSIFPLIISLGFIFLIFIADPAIRLIFGKAYFQSINVLRILLIGSAFFFVSTIPSSIILYYFGKSNISFSITVLRYILMVLLLIILIPKYQAIGGALAFSISEFFSLFAMTIYVIWKFKF